MFLKLLEFLPNVHMLGMFTMLFAIVYRGKGIIPVIVFILLEGAYTGFGIWWIPYWYLWPILFLVALALLKKRDADTALLDPGAEGLRFVTQGRAHSTYYGEKQQSCRQRKKNNGGFGRGEPFFKFFHHLSPPSVVPEEFSVFSAESAEVLWVSTFWVQSTLSQGSSFPLSSYCTLVAS